MRAHGNLEFEKQKEWALPKLPSGSGRPDGARITRRPSLLRFRTSLPSSL